MVYIGADHDGYSLKTKIAGYLKVCGIPFMDLSPKFVRGDDYPKIAFSLGEKVAESPNNFGVLVCDSGLGMLMAANKVKGVRAVFGYSDYAARKSRLDIDANVITFSGAKHSSSEVIRMIDIFLHTATSPTERHVRRRQEIIEYEGNNVTKS